ncbi:MAG TPA: bacillithiol biosynthesis cysteine-adding enzyme BshC [Vicinamibacterales bacterium]|nr:bacillithiol biosynthesis cysteine-adding enzyme BshC [Vicinamibacterales bacterium]
MPVATASRIPVDIRRFPWIKPFVADYAFDYAKVAEFFAGDPRSPQAWQEAIARSRDYARPLDAITDVVQAQQQRRGAPTEAIAAAARLRDRQTVAVVTGQQAGLFGGPLFTLLKALTALELAETVRAQHGVPVVAIFWIDAEDHDWDEVKSCGVLDASLTHRTIAIGDPPGAQLEPVARVRLDHTIGAALAELANTLAPTEFTAPLLETLRNAYDPGTGMADAFGKWMESVLGSRGLVVYNSADPAAKPLAASVFAREIERAGETARLAAAAGAAMESRGYSAQVTPHPDTVALFHLNRGRQPIRIQDDMLVVGDDVRSKNVLLDRVREAPHEFSPNVLLRPIVQDTLFPTICYVAGPNELAYLGQLRNIYAAFGVPMPLMTQRGTATLLDSNAARFLVRHDVQLDQLQAQDEALLNRLLESQLPPGVDAAMHDVALLLQERMEQLAMTVVQIDATLEGAARSALGRMQDDLKKLHGKMIQAAKRKDETLRRQFHHVQAQAFPDGHPQERSVGFVHFLNKYGPTLIDRLVEELPPDIGIHWVITP